MKRPNSQKAGKRRRKPLLFTTVNNFEPPSKRSRLTGVLETLKLEELEVNQARVIPWTSPLFPKSCTAARKFNLDNKKMKVSVHSKTDANKKKLYYAIKRIV